MLVTHLKQREREELVVEGKETGKKNRQGPGAYAYAGGHGVHDGSGGDEDALAPGPYANVRITGTAGCGNCAGAITKLEVYSLCL